MFHFQFRLVNLKSSNPTVSASVEVVMANALGLTGL